MKEKTRKIWAYFILFAGLALITTCGGGGEGGGTSSSPSAGPSSNYSVIYDGNNPTEGTPPVDDKTYSPTFMVTVLDKGTLKKTNYTFAGWNTQANGNGTNRAPFSTFAMGSANAILYAKWTADPTYTVTYDANTGTGAVPTDTNNYLPGSTVTVLGIGTLSRAGYTFAGWNTQPDGNGTDHSPSSTFVMGPANVILYAKWTAGPTYTVTYNPNTATGAAPTDTNHYQPGATVTVLENATLTKTGYMFAGWNTQPDGNGTDHHPSSTFAMGTANVILYAKWTAYATYTVTYDANTGTGGVLTDSNHYQAGAAVTVLGPGTLTKAEYSFVGWNTQPDGSGTDQAPSSTLIMGTADVILYAKWAPNLLSSDDNTVLLDHFDGAIEKNAEIFAYIEDGTICSDKPKPPGVPKFSYGPGPSGLNEALSLAPPENEPPGSATYLKYTGSQLLTQANGTLEFWVFLNSYGNGLTLVERLPYFGSCDKTFGMSVSASGQLSATALFAFDMDSGAATVPLGTWSHVALSWGSNGAKLYINKVQVGSDTNTGRPAFGSLGSVMLRLGTHEGVTTSIDELRISDIQRTW